MLEHVCTLYAKAYKVNEIIKRVFKLWNLGALTFCQYDEKRKSINKDGTEKD